MIKRWNILSDSGEDARKLAESLGVSEVLARLLWNRNIRTTDAARVFLAPEHRQEFYDPFLMTGMQAAVDCIAAAISSGEHITIYGDYDVDGMTASSLLYHCLRSLGVAAENVRIYIPDRFQEGYGFNAKALTKLAETTDLLVSVDCGISCAEEVAGVEGKMDIVVTDHHLPGKELPECVAVVNPHQSGDAYPDKNLAGVGVAFKLCDALSRTLAEKPWNQGLELVALGTVADVVPLTGENRKIVRMGLHRMMETKNAGLKALIAVAENGAKRISSEAVGFHLAPRLNAAGRLKSAMLGVRLLTTDDATEAAELATYLDELNRERQSVEHAIFEKAEEQLAGTDMAELPAIVLAGEGWHPGVIGIVASRLVEKYYKPTILLSIDGDIAKGSCRSIERLHMHDALEACKEHLLKFGGHAQAAGLSLATKDIEAFRQAFCDYAAAHLTPDDYVPTADVEFEMHPASVTEALVDEIASLEPYGEGNPLPLFGVRDVRGENARAIGGEGQHLKFAIRKKFQSVDMLWWSHGRLASLVNTEPMDIVYRPAINEWQGRRFVQGFVDSVRPAASAQIFPDRDILVGIYKFLLAKQNAKEKIALDPWKLTQDYSRIMHERIPLYTMKAGLQIFSELHILVASLDEEQYHIEVPKTKLDLEASETWSKRKK